MKSGRVTPSPLFPDVGSLRTLLPALKVRASPRPLHDWLHSLRRRSVLGVPLALLPRVDATSSSNTSLFESGIPEQASDWLEWLGPADLLKSAQVVCACIQGAQVVAASGNPLSVIFLHPDILCGLCKPVQLLPGRPSFQ